MKKKMKPRLEYPAKTVKKVFLFKTAYSNDSTFGQSPILQTEMKSFI